MTNTHVGPQVDETALLALTNTELDDVFRRAPAGEIPDGNMRGTVLAWPGTPLARPLAFLIYLVAWQGKVVSRERHLLRNKITPLRLRLIAARLSHADELGRRPRVRAPRLLEDLAGGAHGARRDPAGGTRPLPRGGVALALASRLVHPAVTIEPDSLRSRSATASTGDGARPDLTRSARRPRGAAGAQAAG